MSLHAPFLVKQYLSSDVESGSYSRIFWYYPLDRDKVNQGGIGLFFEVLSGDVEDEVYEQITKRFWDSFTGNFYGEGFEPALKKSIKMFIQLLRNFSVEEGLDVNIVLLNVVESTQGYTLKLISFGDSDIFVVRQGKFADMSKMVPTNDSLYDLKFLEVELDLGDVLMLGNKTLLRNAFETDMLELTGLDELLTSLEAFKDNLFGSKKLFLIAATGEKEKMATPKISVFERFKKVASAVGNVSTKIATFAGGVAAKMRKPKQRVVPVPVMDETPGIVEADLVEPSEPSIEKKPLEMLVEDLGALPKEEADKDEHVAVIEESKPDDQFEVESESVEWPGKMRHVEPPPVEDVSEDEVEVATGESQLERETPEFFSESPVHVIDASSDVDDDEKPEEESHLVEPVEPLPGKSASVEDFVVTEEVTPSMVVEKSEYKELLDDAIEEDKIAPTSEAGASGAHFVRAPSAPVKGANYVNELRARHSAFGKIASHPFAKSMAASLLAFWLLLVQKILGLFGKAHLVSERKLFLSRPSIIEKGKKRQPGMLIIFGLIVLGTFFWIRAKISLAKVEAQQLTEYQTVVATFSEFYDSNISVIDTEDTERQLELCVPEAEKVYAKEKVVLEKMKTEKTIASVKSLTSQVQAKVVECQAKYDRIYGIVRVKDAELITDFKVSLGNDSDISAISLRSGGIVVADKGRKSVYQVNVQTSSVMKMEDPLGLVVEPLTVGTGDGTLFVCDKVNGVLYYSKNASGNLEGFNRVVGAEPTSIGECSIVEGFQKNAYVVPNTANVVYKIVAKKAGGFEAPSRYIANLLGVRSLSIDGHIYVVTSIDGKGGVTRYYGGKLDNFAIPQSADLGELTASYSNPSAERNLYVYDKTKHAVLSIEKPNSKHPGRGVVEKTYMLESSDKFSDVRSIAVDLNVRNQEVYMYILSGTTIWRFKL